MLPYRVSNPGPLTYESCALPISLRGLASLYECISLESDSLKSISSGVINPTEIFELSSILKVKIKKKMLTGHGFTMKVYPCPVSIDFFYFVHIFYIHQ